MIWPHTRAHSSTLEHTRAHLSIELLGQPPERPFDGPDTAAVVSAPSLKLRAAAVLCCAQVQVSMAELQAENHPNSARPQGFGPQAGGGAAQPGPLVAAGERTALNGGECARCAELEVAAQVASAGLSAAMRLAEDAGYARGYKE
eukprot:SAG11_NODE_16510_length_545_cov_1.381166_1_plen_144_part_10